MKSWNPDEPARQPDYRRMYHEFRKYRDRVTNIDSCITFLLIELRAVQKRLNKLEQHNANIASQKFQAAVAGVDELGQHNNLREGEARTQEIRHCPVTTGL